MWYVECPTPVQSCTSWHEPDEVHLAVLAEPSLRVLLKGHRHTNLQSVYRKHEQIKKRAYEQQIREVEHATFSPLVLSATGGLAREANIFYKRLASMLASKWDYSYSSTLCWLHCRLSFSLLRSSIQAIRGARSSCGRTIRMPMVVDLVNSESHLSSA